MPFYRINDIADVCRHTTTSVFTAHRTLKTVLLPKRWQKLDFIYNGLVAQTTITRLRTKKIL